jgi:2-iminobutanoate/2-iminopropanoate deaminase
LVYHVTPFTELFRRKKVAADKNTLILVLVFVCGLLAGCVLYGLLAPQPVPPVKQIVFTEKAPNPIGPYSQAVRSGDFVFLSGQIGIDPVTGNLSGTAEEQTARAMENLHAVLQESGLGFGDVVQTRIYLTDMNDWTTVNRCYGSYFTDGYPARATVQVSGLPKGAKVEIEMVAQKQYR